MFVMMMMAISAIQGPLASGDDVSYPVLVKSVVGKDWIRDK